MPRRPRLVLRGYGMGNAGVIVPRRRAAWRSAWVGSARRWQIEQRVRGDRVDLARVEQPDDAVLTVEARRPPYVTGPQPPDRLTEQLAADPCHVVQGCLAEHEQLRAERGDEGVEPSTDRPAARPDTWISPRTSASWTRCSTFIALADRRPSTVRLVGEVLDPAEDAHRHRLAALDAQSVLLRRLGGRPVDAAGAVTVRVVFAFFGEQLQRPGQSVSGTQGVAYGGSSRAQSRGPSPPDRARAASGRPNWTPHGIDRDSTHASSSPGRSTDRSRPRRCGRRDRRSSRQSDRIQIWSPTPRTTASRCAPAPNSRRRSTRARSPGGHASRGQGSGGHQIPDCRSAELGVEAFDRVDVGQVDEVMDLPRPVVALVDRRDLNREHEPYVPAGHARWHRRTDVCRASSGPGR